MATTTITRSTELAHRTGNGIDVYLFWNERDSRVTVSVFDERTNDGFELEVDSRDALDAFNHPFAYAARSSMVGASASSSALAPDPATTARTRE
jgi:hypothetical protein